MSHRACLLARVWCRLVRRHSSFHRALGRRRSVVTMVSEATQLFIQSRRPLAIRIVVLLAIWLDALLYGLVVPFLPERALTQGATPFTVGALFATYGLGVVVATFPVGVLTDRIGARRTLLGGLVVLLLATLLFAFAEDVHAYLPAVS